MEGRIYKVLCGRQPIFPSYEIYSRYIDELCKGDIFIVIKEYAFNGDYKILKDETIGYIFGCLTEFIEI